MSARLLTWFCSIMVLAILALTYGEAEAARFGGGRSFGGKPSMSQPFTRSTPPSSSFGQQNTRQGMAATPAANRGFLGGMGGILGGLLAGSLLGSMLTGGGFSGGGFLDILIIALVAYLAFKFFTRRRNVSQNMAAQGAGPSNAPYFGNSSDNTPLQRTAQQPSNSGGFDWGALTGQSSSSTGTSNSELPGTTRIIPAGFDEEEFLRGAKAAYMRLNDSWDKRDINDIAQFTTPAFVAEIRRQATEDPNPGKTEIILINASVIEVTTEGNEQDAKVYFDVLLREDPRQSTPSQIREVWHFVRPASGEGVWKLDGIQQVSNIA